MGKKYFFYGSLRDDDVLELVIQKPVKEYFVSDFKIEGWKTVYVKGEKYPALCEASGGSSEGKLYSGFSDTELEKLNYFEIEYRLSPLDRDSDIWAWLPRNDLELTKISWNFNHFLEFEKEKFLRRTKYYMEKGVW